MQSELQQNDNAQRGSYMANLYVSSWNSNQVLKYDGTTGVFISVFADATASGLSGPRGLRFGGDGKLYVAALGTNNVLRFNADGSYDKIFATGNGLNAPTDILFDAAGKL